MKIEKINNNQIRCTLTKEDLALRHLKISELAYGSEKTQNLFREMIQEADFEYGFEAENMPLMIEAIPVNPEGIVLIITKVNDPDELDTRFSQFTRGHGNPMEDPDSYGYDEDDEEEYDDFWDRSSKEEQSRSFAESLREATDEETEHSVFCFRMDSLSTVMDLAAVSGGFRGMSALYKSEDGRGYLLALQRGQETAATFRNFIRVATEFGTGRRIPEAGAGFLAEHCDVLIAERALEKLRG